MIGGGTQLTIPGVGTLGGQSNIDVNLGTVLAVAFSVEIGMNTDQALAPLRESITRL
ncbi:PTS sugar transporter subunit IIC [Staphylococcus pseudintermedius]|uniref:PTS sugar transporter subunit IIC n=1 Tax=Staphylococcus pseudintermedius TaxID=283734 RepID=UPI00311AADD6